jgi:CRP-like cAMP-binding protein
MTITAKAVLRGNLLLRGLSEDTLDRVAALATRRTWPKNAVLFRQGDPGDALYAVIAGQVRISASSPDGREVYLSLMEAGDTFGEIAVIDGKARTATATAVAESALFIIRRGDLLALIERDPALAVHLLSVFCQRLRWTSELIEEAAFLDMPARLARRLLRLSADHGEQTPRGVSLQISQADLANFLNVSRQVVNQQLQQWRKEGWIALSRGRIVVQNEKALSGVSLGAAPPA